MGECLQALPGFVRQFGPLQRNMGSNGFTMEIDMSPIVCFVST